MTSALKKLLFTLVLIFLSAICIEGLLRIIESNDDLPVPEPSPGEQAVFMEWLELKRDKAGDGYPMVADGQRKWALPRGASIKMGDDTEIKINSIGLRGEDVKPRRHGEVRLFSLGDSTVFGFGVTDDQGFLAVAARLLSRAWGRTVTAVNGGHPGYSSEQTLVTLKMHGGKIQPSWVVIATIWSDIYLENPTITRMQSLLKVPLNHLATYRTLRRLFAPWLRPREVGFMTSDEDIQPRAGFTHRTPLPGYAENLKAMARQAAAIGAKPLFMILPAPLDLTAGRVNEEIRLYRHTMRRVAKQVNAPLVDIPRCFKEVGAGITVFIDQVHPGPTGHRLIGECLAEGLSSHGPPAKDESEGSK